MNFEERLFYSMLNETNLKSELVFIIDYLNRLYDKTVEVHRVKPSQSLDKDLILYLTKKGLAKYFSMKLKKFHEKEFEDDDDKPYIRR